MTAADEHRWAEARVTLRWLDADQLGHVNHALFLTYMAESRYRVDGGRMPAMTSLVTVRLEIDYLAEPHVDAGWVTARSRVLKVGTSSLRTLDEVVRPDGVVVARAETVSVMTDRDTARSRPFTAEERELLESLL